MTLQTEPGAYHRPMRPTLLTLALTTKTLTLDVAPVDWTVLGTRLAFTQAQKFFDDNAKVSVDDANDLVTLPPGIWEIEVTALMVNADAANDESVQLALTNAAGTTVHHSTPSQVIDNGANGFVRLRHVLHLTATDQIAIRAAQVTDTGGGANISVLNGDRAISIRKVGNANEQ